MSLDDATLGNALCTASSYPHATGVIDVKETHISRVYLAGDYAYKVRKPVKFDYVDFSTLILRQRDCEQEVRLNVRFAPDLYLGVVPIVLTGANSVRVGGKGDTIEYAVKMRRFPAGALLNEMIVDNRLSAAHIDLLAARISAFHSLHPRAGVLAGFGTAVRIEAIATHTLSALQTLLPDEATLGPVATKIREHLKALHSSFEARLAHGHVRECHGDLHLGNIVWLNDEPVPFDCLEFDPALRWIDTMNDAAFIFMDLLRLEHPELAWRFLNGYLEAGGDYAGLAVLRFYAALRALIRARVLLELRTQAAATEITADPIRNHAQGLIRLADRILTSFRGDIYLMHGLSGSGKSTLAARMAERQGMIRVRSDVERKRLRRPWAAVDPYGEEETAKTYNRLLAISRIGCCAGFSIVNDATFLSHRWRGRFIAQAKRLGVGCHIVHCEAPTSTLRDRISRRAATAADPSDATNWVLENQLQVQDPLTPDEQKIVFLVSESEATGTNHGEG